MTTAQARQDFDIISAVYDETRPPLDPETVDRLSQFLREHGWESVLEVGVGTGRIAQSLLARGVRVVGVDPSRGMLVRAVAKGIPSLALGTAYHLPFRDRAFDVSLFVHVLHVLDDPGSALAEAERVSRGGVLAIMDRGPEEVDPGRPREPTPRELVRQALTEAGYPDILRAGPRRKEEAILGEHPPREIRLLSDREVAEPLSKQLDTIAKRAYRHVLRVPPEVLERAVAAAREKVGDRTVTFHRREAVVFWPVA